jgi:hypothetical protein
VSASESARNPHTRQNLAEQGISQLAEQEPLEGVPLPIGDRGAFLVELGAEPGGGQRDRMLTHVVGDLHHLDPVTVLPDQVVAAGQPVADVDVPQVQRVLADVLARRAERVAEPAGQRVELSDPVPG